jgi:DNA-binding protein YbaB
MERTVNREANQALWARFAEVQGQYVRMREGLVDLQHQLHQLRVTAVSQDGQVSATVDGRAHLVDLELGPKVYQQRDPRELAALVTATVRRACAQASDRVAGLLSAYLPTGTGAADFVRSGDFGDLLRRQDEASGGPGEVHNGR